MQKTFSKDFTVAIVGGGMVGLACAIGLANSGISVRLFEATAKFDEVGAGVGLAPNALRALKGLGMLETVLNALDSADMQGQSRHCFADGSGDHEVIYSLPEAKGDMSYADKYGVGIYREVLYVYTLSSMAYLLHNRPTFLAAVMPLIDPSIVSFMKRLKSTTLLSSGKYRLDFSDGSNYEADLVIGADGIKSTVRKSVVDSSTSSIAFTNRYTYRGMISVDALKAAGVTVDIQSRMHVFIGPNKMMATYPVKDRTFLNVAATVNTQGLRSPLSTERPYPWVEDSSQEEFLGAFRDGWENGDTYRILQQMKKLSRWTLHSIYPPGLETYVKDRIVLIGDAAHAMVPFLGAGVGQGFEDAYALCRFLSHPKVNKDSLASALQVFDYLRRPRANSILQRSLESGDLTHELGQRGITMSERRERFRMFFESDWHDDLWNYDLEGEVSKALARL